MARSNFKPIGAPHFLHTIAADIDYVLYVETHNDSVFPYVDPRTVIVWLDIVSLFFSTLK